MLAGLPPSTDSLDSVHTGADFLFRQAVAENQREAVVAGYGFKKGLAVGAR